MNKYNDLIKICIDCDDFDSKRDRFWKESGIM